MLVDSGAHARGNPWGSKGGNRAASYTGSVVLYPGALGRGSGIGGEMYLKFSSTSTR